MEADMLTWYLVVSITALAMFLSPENSTVRDQLASPESAGTNSIGDIITSNIFLALILSTAMLVPSSIYHLIVGDITLIKVILSSLLFGIGVVQWNIVYTLVPSRFKR
jgi:hypothetical protein